MVRVQYIVLYILISNNSYIKGASCPTVKGNIQASEKLVLHILCQKHMYDF